MKAGWEEKSVGEVLRLEYGKSLNEADRKPDGRYPVYGANGEKGRTDKFYYDKPSIIIGRKGSTGEINLTEQKFWPLDVTYFVTFDERHHDLRFLYYLLTTLGLPSLAKGVKPGINRNEVYSQVTKVPLLPEQQRIIGILDEAFDSIATAKTNTKKNLQNNRELFQSHLNNIFTNPGKDWREKQLGDLFDITSSKRVFEVDWKREGVPFYRAREIVKLAEQGFVDNELFISEEMFDRYSVKYGIPVEGDIMVTGVGTLGICYVVQKSDRFYFKDGNIIWLKKKSESDSRFVEYAVGLPPEKESSFMLDSKLRKGAIDGQEVLHIGANY